MNFQNCFQQQYDSSTYGSSDSSLVSYASRAVTPASIQQEGENNDQENLHFEHNTVGELFKNFNYN